MSDKTIVKYAEFPLADKWLVEISYGDISFIHAMQMDSFTYESNVYDIIKRHHNMDDDSWIFIVEKKD